MITINGAWYVDNLPNNIVCEMGDGTLKMFFISPLAPQNPEKLLDYKGYHPRKMKGSPLPDYLYRFYGLLKNEESATEVIHVRLTPSEKAKIETYAANHEPRKNVSETIRDYIRSL